MACVNKSRQNAIEWRDLCLRRHGFTRYKIGRDGLICPRHRPIRCPVGRQAYQSDSSPLSTLLETPLTDAAPRKRKPRKNTACLVCRHEHRALIESTRIAGASLDSISAKYDVSRDSLWRHMSRHVSQDVKDELLAHAPLKELAQKAASEGMSVLEYLAFVRSVLMRQFQLAAACNNPHAVAILAGRLNETLREIGRSTGELSALAGAALTINGNVSILNSPQLASLQASILRALGPYPAARQAVVDALRALDADSVPSASASPPVKVIAARGVVP
jgi:hypothetical protein